MYLKSIEMQGFKSFANKIVLDFHPGITAIVGPNGSGKSNVSDAVRWVLGEQSAKQLRSENMQDVIFAGTENRHPLSYAYVAITLDNSDHVLPIEYAEVTVARRVYRSGESEYLLNGSPCRLKDVNELFYDTGIGKEGYSIIGQGQIERILSGKPEDRRELFDEAVGIVKFKKRKAASEKRLENERENLVRVNDILSELEDRVGPLEEQSKTAKRYLSLREDQKKLDVNLYLIEMDRIEKESKETSDNASIVQKDMEDGKAELESIRKNSSLLEEKIALLDERTESIHEEETENTEAKNRLENRISLLEEQIRSAQTSEDSLKDRRAKLEAEEKEKSGQKEKLENDLKSEKSHLMELQSKLGSADDSYKKLEELIHEANQTIENSHEEIVNLLNARADIQSELQKFKTTREQVQIRKAALVRRILTQKTENASVEEHLKEAQEAYLSLDEEEKRAQEELLKKKNLLQTLEGEEKNLRDLRQQAENNIKVEKSRLETLKNIAERYEGYGTAVRKVMEQKRQNPGLIGLVSDLIHVDAKFETAIETALGGNIQNIVTEDESTAKDMISYLKKNHGGRATFLPLTSVHPKEKQVPDHLLHEKGVLGLASDLVETDKPYRDVMRYLLGRVIVMENLDLALAFARKTQYQNHIVTLEGEYLRPGGSLTGGSFKNNNNLLGRRRELEELEERIEKTEAKAKKLNEDLEEKAHILEKARSDFSEGEKALQDLALNKNTAMLELSHAKQAKNEADQSVKDLNQEGKAIEEELKKIDADEEAIRKQSGENTDREAELQALIQKTQAFLEGKLSEENQAQKSMSDFQLKEANLSQKVSFMEENLSRIRTELQKNREEYNSLDQESQKAKEGVEAKKQEIEKLRAAIVSQKEALEKLALERKENLKKKEAMNQDYKGFFDQRESVSNRLNHLDKELYRLNGKRNKLEEELEYQNNYMWSEYELTRHAAMELQDPDFCDRNTMKKQLSSIRDEIRKMGSVNVNAIEEYKEVYERYTFLKGQHDDLIKAEESLLTIIQELDEGMRKQFKEGFHDIQVEFDKAFKALFGGGKGSLELVEGEDLLETGIRIIAQPPGKKLQNMMQMSGGEKSLTAIALLFAIQNLKPSPFCLLDEIEAALDDSNVDRFAAYLHKLTKNTQFIVITHRRGTMNSADRLYGITMQEKGVSTLVSVSLIDQDLAN
ncbi:MAG: chromosome segregation protein SMC [Lachnospiraceae bacterium]|nr:chromosome segregation protein SMC [Lachnospiraceae bacterium]